MDVTDAELSVTVATAAPYGSGARLATAGGCFGLAGLRERIVTLRGTLEARPTPTGGRRLGTRLPLPGLKAARLIAPDAQRAVAEPSGHRRHRTTRARSQRMPAHRRTQLLP